MSTPLSQLKIKLYADGADPKAIARYKDNPVIAGATTNPSLLAKAGITDYEVFARWVVGTCPNLSVSFEVLECEDFVEMKRQALKLAAISQNIFVKIPVITSVGKETWELVKELRESGVRVNITGVTTRTQLTSAFTGLAADGSLPAIVSIFAGRIADRGINPALLVSHAVFMAKGQVGTEILWASTREVFNITQAEACGAHIITLPDAILAKAEKEYGLPADGDDMTLSVVWQFDQAAKSSGLSL